MKYYFASSSYLRIIIMLNIIPLFFLPPSSNPDSGLTLELVVLLVAS